MSRKQGKPAKGGEKARQQKGQRFLPFLLLGETVGELWGANPQVVIYGNQRVTVEGFRSILEYEPDHIKLDLGKTKMRVWGGGLEIVLMNRGTIVIRGTIVNLEYMN